MGWNRIISFFKNRDSPLVYPSYNSREFPEPAAEINTVLGAIKKLEDKVYPSGQ